jgi:hypothetical protein
LILDNIIITQGNNNALYHFENDEATADATTPPADLITISGGTAGVVEYINADGITTNAFKAYSSAALNQTGVAELSMFNSLASNYSVVWKEYYGTPGANKGVLLRGTGDSGSGQYAVGMKQGYLFIVHNNEDNTVSLKTYLVDESGLIEKTDFTTAFTVMPGKACWFRAKAINDQLIFECSTDSIIWVGAKETSFTDNTYPIGSTQLVWGMNNENFDWVMDNIAYLSETVIVSKLAMDGFRYSQGRGPSESMSFSVSGNSTSGDIAIYPTSYFEVSLDPDKEFGDSLILTQNNGSILSTTIYVRLKQKLPVQKFTGSISVLSGGIEIHTIQLNGEVTPQPTTLKYDFTNDVATTMATSPPAINITIAQGNTAGAGVVSYTDANSVTSNMFRPYSGGQRNATGAVNLDLFPDDATDYSVTWKQHIGSAGTEYKTGMLLRGDKENYGSANTGYVQGLMQGYLFIVYHTGSASQFRIYRSTAYLNSLNMITNSGIGTLVPTAGQPVWYRASASGSASVSLIFEYSLDGINWNIGASTTDNTLPTFTAGATQIVWGLAAPAVNFYIDDIVFNGLHQHSGTMPENILVSTSTLYGFNYDFGNGPSEHQSFVVSGKDLTDDIVINAPFGFELSLDYLSDYAPSISLQNNNGVVDETIVFVRLKSGLGYSAFSGELTISSAGSLNMIVDLDGVIYQATHVSENPALNGTVVATEYYSLTGQRLPDIVNLTGIFIVKKHFSDGTITVTKVVNHNR